MVQQDAVSCTKGNSILPHINTNSRVPLLEHRKPLLFPNHQSNLISLNSVSLYAGLKSCMCTLTHTHNSKLYLHSMQPPSVKALHGVEMRSLNNLTRTQSLGQLSQSRICTYTSSLVYLTLSFFTRRSCSHKSCLHHVTSCHVPAH